MKYLHQVNQTKRLEHVVNRLDWFTNMRNSRVKNDVYQSLKLFVRRHIMAKKFLQRSANSIDKQLANEAFSVWKQACSVKRQETFQENINELNRRKQEHEEQIKKFQI